jgi:hypothetical protein
MSDAKYFKAQAVRARELAVGMDPRTKQALLALADEYEQRVRDIKDRETKPG